MMDFWWGHGWFWFVGLAQIVFWVAMIALIASLIRSRSREPVRAKGSDAVAILEERYARGEIDRDEFLERRSVLIEKSGYT